MNATERRQCIIKILIKKRSEKACNLAMRFGVSERTIYNDVCELSFSFPIYTKPGRMDGGIYLDKDFKLDESSEELGALMRAIKRSEGLDKELLQSVIKKHYLNR